MIQRILYTMPLSEKFSLRPLRMAFGWSREKLAVELGVSFDTIGRWERGESSMNKSARLNLERLLQAHGVDTYEFYVTP